MYCCENILQERRHLRISVSAAQRGALRSTNLMTRGQESDAWALKRNHDAQAPGYSTHPLPRVWITSLTDMFERLKTSQRWTDAYERLFIPREALLEVNWAVTCSEVLACRVKPTIFYYQGFLHNVWYLRYRTTATPLENFSHVVIPDSGSKRVHSCLAWRSGRTLRTG